MKFICIQFIVYNRKIKDNGCIHIYKNRLYEYIQGYWLEIYPPDEFYFYNIDTLQIYHYHNTKFHCIQSTDDWLDIQTNQLYKYSNNGWITTECCIPRDLYIQCISVYDETQYKLNLPCTYYINSDNQLTFTSSGIVDIRPIHANQTMIVSYLTYICGTLITYRYLFTRYSNIIREQIIYTGIYNSENWKTTILKGVNIQMVNGMPQIHILKSGYYNFFAQLTYSRGPFCGSHIPNIQGYLYQNENIYLISTLNEIHINTITTQYEQPMNLGCLSFGLNLYANQGDILYIDDQNLKNYEYTYIHGNICIHNI